ncbi:hypothetical protein A3194_13070 [Candidatus Thiodiazotropha endoloripes]|uniref:ABC transporter substrate-binding protein n=1 Tax=Candidatus Thiodiazotropha endoloripes TaxID=1818881 RepID=UPI00083DC651|nr:hypothetical protein [Candidatus Thiodiazotropha endoloripes]MCG7901535.1 hypothetical protein [Candidatus Thiodiazotropha weberae]MCG7915757.1 hypothetical protein [Candidatus Thiodiazotropha weberae]ODB85751.1 hypothetical protein A3194_13070 [Candidatus Thiodiazotropha endoloripes]
MSYLLVSRRLRWIVALLIYSVMSGSQAVDVLLISSYHKTDACGQPQYEAALDALEQGGLSGLTTKAYYLDARIRSREEMLETVGQIKQEIRGDRPKLVFTFDDTAFALLYEDVLAQPETKMVFSGLNRDLSYYDSRADFIEDRTPVANITGIFEYLFMREQFSILEAILNRPVKRVAILYSTDTVGQILKDQILDELKGTPYAQRIALFPAEDVPAMQQKAREINDDPDIDAYIPVTMSVPDPADGKRKTMDQLAPLLTKSIRKIDLTLNSSFTEYGFFGGVSIDFYQMGFQTGYLATRLLKGGAIEGAQVENARRSIIAINRHRMGELGISLSPDLRSIVDKWVD